LQTESLQLLLLLSQTLFPCECPHTSPKYDHTPSSQRVRRRRTDHKVHGRSQDRSNSSTQLSLSISIPRKIKLTFDLKLPIALPRFKSDCVLESSSQQAAAAAVRPVTTVALVYARQDAARYRTTVGVLPCLMLSRGRIESKVRARVQARMPLRDTVSSPDLANDGLTWRACSIAARIPISTVSYVHIEIHTRQQSTILGIGGSK